MTIPNAIYPQQISIHAPVGITDFLRRSLKCRLLIRLCDIEIRLDEQQ